MMKNVMILISGTMVAQAVPVLVSPLLTRMYTPADFGVLAIFTALTSVVGGIANGRYDGAILLPEKDEDAINLGAFGACFAICVSLCFLLLTVLFHGQITALLDNEEISPWLYAFPFTALLISITSLLYQLNLRDKNYANLTRSTIARTVAQTAIQLGVGSIKAGEHGLIAGQVLSYVAGNGVLLRKNRSWRFPFSAIRFSDMWRLAKRYANFPKFSIWATLANTLSFNLIPILISAMFGAVSLGFYSVVNRVLGMPMTVVGDAVGQVFQREARDALADGARMTAILTKTLLRLTAVSFPLFAVLYLWSEEIFLFVFGEQWAPAGTYTRLLIPLFLARFLAVPVMSILNLYEKQRITLLWQMGLLLLVVAVGAISSAYGANIEQFFTLLAYLLLLYYTVLLIVLYRVSLGATKGDTMKGKHCCLVLNGYVNGYSIIRELHARGVRDIILFDTTKSLAAYSNRIKKFVKIEPSVSSLKQGLEALHREYEQIVLFPTAEAHMEQLYELREEIADYCFLPFNHENLLESISKITQYEHCEKAGVPYPKSVFLLCQADLDKVNELPFPVIVKPSQRDSIQNDVFRHLLVRSREEFQRHVPQLLAHLSKDVSFLVSEVIPGPSSNIYAYVGYRNKEGQIVNEWVGKKLSQYPNRYGVFASASNQAPPEILQQGRKLLESMNLYGIAEPEFKYDPRDGTYKLMEINLRSAMWNRVGYLSGVSILYTQYLDAIGEKPRRERQKQTKDIHFVYFKYECLGLLNGTIPFRQFWENLFHSDKTYFAVFDPKDLKPFLVDTLSILEMMLKKAAQLFKRAWRMKHENHEKHTSLGSSTRN